MIDKVRCVCGRWVLKKHAIRVSGTWIGPECQKNVALAEADSAKEHGD